MRPPRRQEEIQAIPAMTFLAGLVKKKALQERWSQPIPKGKRSPIEADLSRLDYKKVLHACGNCSVDTLQDLRRNKSTTGGRCAYPGASSSRTRDIRGVSAESVSGDARGTRGRRPRRGRSSPG
jgi:hypothetical protein